MAKAPVVRGTVADLMASLDSALGVNDEAQEVKSFIDTGYAPLNAALSGREDGGIPQGRLTEVFGESSTGKTALATKWMVQAQSMGGVAGFVDWERSFDLQLAVGFGLSDKRPYWMYKRPETWEEGCTFSARASQLIRESGAIPDDAPILFVHDSIASAVPQSMLYDSKGKRKEMSELGMNDTTALARVSSTTLKLMAQVAGEYNATFLFLNQVRLKPGVTYGDPRTTPGGKAMEFYSTCRMSLGRDKLMETDGKDKVFTGQRINIKVEKSKLTRPFQSADLRLMYDENEVAFFDIALSSIEYLTAKKALTMAGSYVVWSDGSKSYPKALAKKINADPLLLAELRKMVVATLSH